MSRINIHSYNDSEVNQLIGYALAEFYLEMNLEAKQLKLTNTHFCSAHGMHHDLNYSSAFDIAVLSHHCMKHLLFRQIVKT